MNVRKFGNLTLALLVAFIASAEAIGADGLPGDEKRFGLSGGSVLLEFDAAAMADAGISFPVEAKADGTVSMQFEVDPAASSFQLARVNGASAGLYGVLATQGSGEWSVKLGEVRQNLNIGDFLIGFAGRHGQVTDAQDIHLEILRLSPESVKVDFDGAFGVITVSGELVVSEQLATNLLDQPTAAGKFVGHITIQGVSREAMEPSEPDAGEAGPRAPGADVTVGELRGSGDSPGTQPSNYGVAGGYAAYSVGTTSCNVGTIPLWWYTFGAANPTWHPVINQGLYRYNVVNGSGRFEMLGQAWLKHGFCALQGTVCGGCSPFCGGCCNNLGVGCSDPYTAARNGDRSGMGPKSQINAASGQIQVWPYPTPSTADVTLGRLRVATADVNPSLNAGAAYYAEGMYVAQDDASAGNDDNNASYRRCQFAQNASFSMTWFSTASGQTVRQQAAINAWKVHDPVVQIVHVDVPSDGRFTIGYRVTDLSGNGSGPWHYEYAVFNMNSDRSASSISIPLPSGSVVTNTGFRDVEYHGGDGATIGTNYAGTDWPATVNPGTSVAWNMPVASPATNSNALRWGTLYNYRFDADSPPTAGNMTIGLYKFGEPASVTASVQVPSVPTCDCPGDLDNSGAVDGGDIAPFTQMYIGNIGTGICAQVEKPTSGPLDLDDLDMFVNLLLNVTPCK